MQGEESDPDIEFSTGGGLQQQPARRISNKVLQLPSQNKDKRKRNSSSPNGGLKRRETSSQSAWRLQVHGGVQRGRRSRVHPQRPGGANQMRGIMEMTSSRKFSGKTKRFQLDLD